MRFKISDVLLTKILFYFNNIRINFSLEKNQTLLAN